MEHVTAGCVKSYPVKRNLTPSVFRNLSKDYIAIDSTLVDYICLHLILSNFLSTDYLHIFRACSKSFNHFHTSLFRTEPKIIYNLFQNDPDCDCQTTMSIERRLQFLFLAVIHHMHVPSTIRSLTINFAVSCRDAKNPSFLKGGPITRPTMPTKVCHVPP